MRSLRPFLLLATAVLVAANPLLNLHATETSDKIPRNEGHLTSTCLAGPKATNIVDTFISLVANPRAPDFTSKANALFADSFIDYSDTANFLTGRPLGSVTFPNKTAIIASFARLPPRTPSTTLDIFFSCNRIAWRWVGEGDGSKKYQITGINLFTINQHGQIREILAEFNSGASLANAGYPECSSNSTLPPA